MPARSVAEDQRRRPGLSRPMAARQKLLERGGIPLLLTEPLGPLVGELRQWRIEVLARGLDRGREWPVEIAVQTLAEPVSLHVDRGAKAPGIEERIQLVAFGVAEDDGGLDEAVAVQ